MGNDEGTIGRTVEHLRRNKYTRSMFDVIVAPVNCTDQTPTIARRKGAVVYGPGKQRWSDADEAVHGVLERLSAKDRYDAYVILDVRSRISANFLAVMSDKLSGAHWPSSPDTAYREENGPGIRRKGHC